MRRSPIFYIFVILCFSVSLFAAENTGSEGMFTIILDILSLGFLAVAFFYSWRIYTQYKEGQLSIPWGLIAAGIIFLFIGRIVQAGVPLGYWSLPQSLNSGIYVVVSIVLAFGFVTYKKYIS